MSKDENIKDYRDTLLLPKTELPMKAKLPENEPNFLEFWKKIILIRELEKILKVKKNLFFTMALLMPMVICIWELLLIRF